MPLRDFKQVNFKTDKWEEHDRNAKKLKAKIGLSSSSIGIAEYLNIAAKFFEESQQEEENKGGGNAE